MTKPTILLVDYDPKTIEATVQPLSDAGYDVAVARDGEAGLEALGTLDPDLVLLEMMLPKKPGLEVCREIRRIRPQGGPPILMLGNSAAEKYRFLAAACGADAYVPRGTAPAALVEICNDHLQGRPVELETEHEPFASTVASPRGSDAPSPEEIEASFDALFAGPKVAPVATDPRTDESAATHPPAMSSVVAEIVRASQGGGSAPDSGHATEVQAKPKRGARTWGVAVTGAAMLAGGALLVRAFLGGAEPRPRVAAALPPEAPLAATMSPRHDLPAPPAETTIEPSPVSVPPEAAAAPAEPPATPPERSASLPRAERTPSPRTSATAGARRLGWVSDDVLAGVVVHESMPQDSSSLEPQVAAAAEVAAPPEAVLPTAEGGGTAVRGAEPHDAAPLLVDAAPLLERDVAWPGAERSAEAGDLVDLRDVDAEPVALSRPAPPYPESARRMRREGTVSLRLLVNESGEVTLVEPVGASPSAEFLASAQRAARKWTYRPARKDGVPVKVWIPVQVVFKP